MNRTLKAAILGGCALLLASAARAETNTVLASNGAWAVHQYTADDGRISCLLTTPVPDAGPTVGIAVIAGEDQLRVNVAYANWSTPKSFVTRLDVAFDDIPGWGQDGSARAESHHVGTLISLQSTREFVHEFTAGSTMRVTVTGASPLLVSLAGTTAIWGAFMDCAKLSSPTVVAAISGVGSPQVAAAPSPPAAPAGQPATTEVRLVTRGGLTQVQGIAGRSTPILFVLDSGASPVQLPRAEAWLLIEEGSSVPTGQTAGFIDANGKETPHMIYTLGSLKVGERTVNGVELGQSFLGRLGSWSINNARQTLVLGAPTAG